jgi:hypothetical protein
MIHAAYFSDFKWGPKLLLWGDLAGLEHVALVLEKLRSGAPEVALTGFANNAPEILVLVATEPHGMQRKSANRFEWKIDLQHVAGFLDLITSLVKSNTPGHQYLECGVPGEIVVMVSRDKYPPDLGSK